MKAAAAGAGVREGRARAQPPARGAPPARAPARRQRVGRHARHRRGRRPGDRRQRAGASRSATACCPTASPSTSRTSPSRGPARSRSSSCSSTTATRWRSRRQIIVAAARSRSDLAVLAEMFSERRGARVEVRAAERGDKRRLLELAERNARARARAGEAQGRAPAPAARRGARRPPGGARARRAAAAHRVLRHLEPDGHAHGRVDGRLRGRRAEEVRLPPLHHPRARGRRARRLRRDGGGPLAPARPVGVASRTSARTTPSATSRSRRCRTSIVIDGGPGQLGAGLRALEGFRDARASRSSRSPSASRRSSCRAGATRSCSATTRPALQLLQRVRDEAHRFAITHHRTRRDRAMTASLLDELPGRRPGAQAHAAQPLRLARGGRRRDARAARGRPRAARQDRARALRPSAPDGRITPPSPTMSEADDTLPAWPRGPAAVSG